MQTKLLNLVETHIVPGTVDEIRLSDYVPGIFITIPSKKGMKKAIDKGLVKINGKRAYTADYIRGGETIGLYQHIAPSYPEIELNLEILFEDQHLAVLNKPPGIEVSGNKKWVLENAFTTNIKRSPQKDALPRAQAIHRLDFPTSGVLLLGKTHASVIALNRLFAERQVVKTYLAITIGGLHGSGTVSPEIDGKASLSHYQVIKKVGSERFGSLNLTRLSPHTGRKHQLRKHMASLGCPILGDATYGKEGLILKGKGLYLHASSLEFKHPVSNEPLKIIAPLPKKFLKIFPKGGA